MTAASQRIYQLINLIDNPNTYLEIGVDKGTTFLDININEKYAVDPKFKFDHLLPTAQVAGHHYLETTSDEFFSSLGPEVLFDLVFLDGLHEYEQTYRDFTSSLSRLKPGGIIVIDDTFPFDVFSSHRSNTAAINLRSKFGQARAGWNGDVFKSVLMISIFNADVNYCSLFGEGIKSQTFFWRRKGSLFCAGRPNPQDFQAAIHNLSACNYLWLLENIDLLNPVSSLEEVVNMMQITR
jgi:hypothetical protein